MDFHSWEAKIDKISDQVTIMRETQARFGALLEANTREIKEDLREHMRRTAAAENRLDLLEKDSAKWKGALWATGALAGIASGLATLLVEYFSKN